MSNKAEEILAFIMERCLWQFHSRSWDREENINGIMKKTFELLTGKTITAETPQEKCFYADAKILVDELKAKFSWIETVDEAEAKTLTDTLIDKLIDINITKSLNAELKVPFY